MDAGAHRLQAVLERIDRAARGAGRDPQDITLVAVTKTVSLDRVLPVIQAGIRNVGENRVQEALGKFADASGARTTTATLHLIGPLQSNKAKKAVSLFDMVQSLDRLDLADDLNRHARAANKKLPCLVEVKISDEDSKSGVALDEVPGFIEALQSRPSLEIKGLMGIPPSNAVGEKARPYFATLRKLFDKLNLQVLSMGMSGDFEAAIAEGSTMVRIGSALFGARS